MSTAFAEMSDVIMIEGVNYDQDQMVRATALLPLVSDLIRSEGAAVGVNVDEKAQSNPAYASLLKLVTCDVVARAIRQNMSGDALSQESQSALGYTWSGTYAIPGGGTAMALMDKERKMLGLKRQRYGVVKLWDGSRESV